MEKIFLQINNRIYFYNSLNCLEKKKEPKKIKYLLPTPKKKKQKKKKKKPTKSHAWTK